MQGIIFGCFDILHYGHIRAIKYCLRNCDHLTIGLFTRNAIEEYKNEPAISFQERKIMLEEIFPSVVIVPVRSHDASSFPTDETYDILFVSDTYCNKKLYMLPKSEDIIVIYIPHTRGISSSKIKKRLQNGN